MEQLQANIYALSDKAVVYSENVYWEHRPILKPMFESDHTFLDDFYHLLQERLVINGWKAKKGSELFKMSELQEAQGFDCYNMVKDIMYWYQDLVDDLEKLIKDEKKMDLQNDYIDFLKGCRVKAMEYSKFLKDNDKEEWAE